ncbi:DNA polymerase [Marinospirillum insulare]|uniref:DNA-directed DNA polymerase family A palm domain-containing protein n=1 Tax=Marinospirillum insulare TaxID=217169 RepID=A0ABQ5ZSY3_9GAMM|nr:DNA polymerase [Marinospirillum insulare]GLR63246.1 hypothetical protein GCM10007878_06810 [Marinospirillum insulare]
MMRLYRQACPPAAESIERQGVKIDVLQLHSQEMARRIMELEEEAYAIAGKEFNLNSPKQLAENLFVEQKLPILRIS